MPEKKNKQDLFLNCLIKTMNCHTEFNEQRENIFGNKDTMRNKMRY